MEVRELQAGDEFGRQPRYIKQWGLNVVMTPAEKDMIIVANDSFRGRTWEFEKSRHEWMLETGLCSDAIRRAEARLCSRGVLTVLGGGNGRHRVKRYRYNPKLAQPYLETAQHEFEDRKKADADSRPTGDRRSRKRAVQSRKRGDPKSRKGRPKVAKGATQSRETHAPKEVKTKPTTSTTLTVDAALIFDDQVNANEKALRHAGVLNPSVVQELATDPRITPETIRLTEKLFRHTPPEFRGGAIVTSLRKYIPSSKSSTPAHTVIEPTTETVDARAEY